jgi:ABC-2 type transport system permease protein
MLELKFQIREPQTMIYQLFFPVFLLILFQAIWRDIPNYINILFPGLVGMVIASSSFYGIGASLNAYNRYDILKYWSITPLDPSYLIISLILSRIVFVLIITALLLCISIPFYHLKIVSPFWLFIIIIGIGISLSAIGALISAIAKSPSSAVGIASFFFFPMLFLSGTFFSTEYFPKFLFIISKILPLTGGVNLLRNTVEGGKLYNLPDMFSLISWGVGSFICTCLMFKRQKRE